MVPGCPCWVAGLKRDLEVLRQSVPRSSSLILKSLERGCPTDSMTPFPLVKGSELSRSLWLR